MDTHHKNEIIRGTLNTQTSILYSKAKKIKYAIPSQMKAETIKIYRLMDVKRDRTP